MVDLKSRQELPFEAKIELSKEGRDIARGPWTIEQKKKAGLYQEVIERR